METYEILNKALKPVDKTVRFGFDALRKANLYDPLQGRLYSWIKKTLRAQFERDYRLEVLGLENVPEEGGAVLAANHQSWLDAQALGVALERKVHFVAKSEFEKWPLLSQFIELSESVYIRRGGDNEGLKEVAEKLKEGWLIGIFPEGTIPGEESISRKELEPDTGLLPGKTGAVRLALMAGVPIIPVGVSGTGEAFPAEAYPRMETLPFPKKLPITLRFGAPIHYKGMKIEETDRKKLRELTHDLMKSISALVDHKRKSVPIEVPIAAPDLRGLDGLPKTKGAKKAPWGAVVLHGFTSALNTVSGIEDLLKARGIPYRFPILRGHGSMPHDMIGVTFEQWFEDALAAIQETREHAERIVLMGFSMGGLVALEMGIKKPELADKIVLIAPALKFHDPLAALTPALAQVFKFWDSPKAYADLDLEKKNNRNYRFFPTRSFLSLYNQAQQTEKRLGKFNRPVLILHSKNDKVVSPKAAETILKKIKSKEKRIEWFKQSGHEMMLDLESDKVFGVIGQFLNDLE